MKPEIVYMKGDAVYPQTAGNKIIVHVCNDIGGWGKGFVTALSKRWKAPEKQYREWHKSGEGFALGAVQFVQVEDDMWIANIIGQHDITRKGSAGKPPVRYEAIAAGLKKTGAFAVTLGATVHMPRIGCGLAGGTWDRIEPLIQADMLDKYIEVTVYDL